MQSHRISLYCGLPLSTVYPLNHCTLKNKISKSPIIFMQSHILVITRPARLFETGAHENGFKFLAFWHPESDSWASTHATGRKLSSGEVACVYQLKEYVCAVRWICVWTSNAAYKYPILVARPCDWPYARWNAAILGRAGSVWHVRDD